jgi:hypothetical protein
VFDPVNTANPVWPQSNLEKAIAYICIVLTFCSFFLWLVTDFNRHAQVAMMTGQVGLFAVQFRAWRRSKRNSKQLDAKS